MAWTPEMREKYISEAMARRNKPGYYEAMMQRHEALWAAFHRMNEDAAALTEKYPDKWAAVGKDGLLAVGDSPEEVAQEVEDQGLRRWEYVIEHLETDPVPLIL